MPVLTAASVYRKFVVDGVPDSGPHDPKKAEIVQLLEGIQTAASAPAVVRLTKAALDLVTPVEETYGGQVLDDPDPTKNGYYYRASSAWVKGRGFPDTAAELVELGGTANAVTAGVEAGVNPADIKFWFIAPLLTNDDDVVLNGLPVRNVNGDELAPGEWTAGRLILLVNRTTEWRLLSDPDADGAAASAAASAAAAAASAVEAIGVDWQGAYNGATAYLLGDGVIYNGSSWRALGPTTGNAPPTLPTISNAYWELIARRGTDGAGTVVSIVAGDGIAIDNTDPTAPIISAAIVQTFGPPQGRITTASGIAVMTANALAATTLYYTPCNGNMVPIYDGGKFVPLAFTQLSQTTTDTTKSPTACAANTNYDLFIWDDGGTLRCTRGPAWSNSGAGTSARGTGAGTAELDFTTPLPTNKVAITNGPAANRGTYVGSIRTNASSRIDMSFGGSASGGVAGFNGIWNMYNRSPGAFVCIDSGTAYTYSTDAPRQSRASLGNQHTLFFGLAQDAYSASYSVRVDTPATTGAYGIIGIGLNTKTVFNTQRVFIRTVAALINIGSPYMSITRMPAIGHVVIAAMENVSSGDACNFNPDATGALQAEVWW